MNRAIETLDISKAIIGSIDATKPIVFKHDTFGEFKAYVIGKDCVCRNGTRIFYKMLENYDFKTCAGYLHFKAGDIASFLSKNVTPLRNVD